MKRFSFSLAGFLLLAAVPAPAAVTLVDTVRNVSVRVSEITSETVAQGVGATGLFDEEENVSVSIGGSTAIATASQLSFIAADGLSYEASNETEINNESSVIGTEQFAPVQALSEFLVEFQLTGTPYLAHLTAEASADDSLGGRAESAVLLEEVFVTEILRADSNGPTTSLDETVVLNPGLYRLRAWSVSEDFDAETFFAGANFAFQLGLTAIPEPSAPMLLFAPAMAWLLRRRRVS